LVRSKNALEAAKREIVIKFGKINKFDYRREQEDKAEHQNYPFHGLGASNHSNEYQQADCSGSIISKICWGKNNEMKLIKLKV